MCGSPTTDITAYLLAWKQGEKDALAELLPRVYARLVQIAAAQLRREDRHHVWQPSELVHESYLRLLGQRRVYWHSRGHFFAIAAKMMRRVLIDHARSAGYAKRGGGAALVPLEDADGPVAVPATDFVALRDALQALARRSGELAHIVELRYFGGLTKAEIAAALEISDSTVSRRWRMARAWLHRFLVHQGRYQQGD